MIVLRRNLFETLAPQYYRAPNAPNAPATIARPAPKELMRQTFNSLPNRGRDLNIAGKGQNPMLVNPIDQKTFDTRYSKVAAGVLNNSGGSTIPKAGVPVVAVKPTPNISGIEAAKIAVQKGAQATKEAIGKGYEATKGAVQHGFEATKEAAIAHPAIAGGVAGVAGGLALGAGLRKLLRKNKEE